MNEHMRGLDSIQQQAIEANKWVAHGPFLLCKEHDSNPIEIDLFSIVTKPRLAITLYFPPEYKPSDEGDGKCYSETHKQMR